MAGHHGIQDGVTGHDDGLVLFRSLSSALANVDFTSWSGFGMATRPPRTCDSICFMRRTWGRHAHGEAIVLDGSE